MEERRQNKVYLFLFAREYIFSFVTWFTDTHRVECGGDDHRWDMGKVITSDVDRQNVMNEEFWSWFLTAFTDAVGLFQE